MSPQTKACVRLLRGGCCSALALLALAACSKEHCKPGEMRCTDGGVEECLEPAQSACALAATPASNWQLILPCQTDLTCVAVDDAGVYGCAEGDGGPFTQAESQAATTCGTR